MDTTSDQVHAGSEATAEKAGTTNVAVFYITFVLFVVAEEYIVGALMSFATWLHLNRAWTAWAIFTTGAILLSLWMIRITQPHERLRDPILKAACYLQRRFDAWGMVFNALILGSIASTIALKREDHPHHRVLGVLTAVIYSSVWVPLFVLVWPIMGW